MREAEFGIGRKQRAEPCRHVGAKFHVPHNGVIEGSRRFHRVRGNR
jgi:hypothetical protein